MFGTYKIKTLSHVSGISDLVWEKGKEGFRLVRMEGLEPTSLAALDPKSSASTNFATSADFYVFLNRILKMGMQI